MSVGTASVWMLLGAVGLEEVTRGSLQGRSERRKLCQCRGVLLLLLLLLHSVLKLRLMPSGQGLEHDEMIVHLN